MKTRIQISCRRLGAAWRAVRVLPALITGIALLPSGRVAAQTFTNLYSLNAGTDGANPQAGLVLSGNTFYGTTVNGGASGYGTVFAVNTDGTGYTNLYSFASSDGANPQAGLVLSGNTLYGTTANGGAPGYGTVFSIGTNGMGFSNLYSFSYNDGANPQTGLILSGNTLFGTTQYGGNSGAGTVFTLSTDGTVFTSLYTFTYGSDGAFPMAGLVLSGNTLFGTAQYGGDSGVGTVFALSTNGFTFTTLYTFTNGSDGAYPVAGVVL